MATHVIRMPDVGEGVAEAELVEWHVAVGDVVREDDVLAAVMTDKATVEIPSPAEGRIEWLGAEVGDVVAVGSPIVQIRVAGGGDADPADRGAAETPTPDPSPQGGGGPETSTPSADTGSTGSPQGASHPASDSTEKPGKVPKRDASESPSPLRGGVKAGGAAMTRTASGAPRAEGERPLASPAVRRRARDAGVDLRQVRGSGPAGRIGHDDLDAFIARGSTGGTGTPAGRAPREGFEEVRVVGLRRRIAEKMALSASRIPHITYVEEVDVSEVEALRQRLNADKRPDRPRLTILPFVLAAMCRAIEDQPAVNATYDDEAGIVRRHAAMHVGIATQTPSGLMVPVVRHAEARDIWDCAAEIARLAEAARNGTATREELSGSTITITSLGAMGGLVTTPVINHPEVAIVGVNKIAVRPHWDGNGFVPRRMMNLSSSFDHRVIDGWDAAVFIQRVKALLETPALIFVQG